MCAYFALDGNTRDVGRGWGAKSVAVTLVQESEHSHIVGAHLHGDVQVIAEILLEVTQTTENLIKVLEHSITILFTVNSRVLFPVVLSMLPVSNTPCYMCDDLNKKNMFGMSRVYQ